MSETVSVPYEELTAQQKLRSLWHRFTDADPVPLGFDEEMEAAGLIELVPVTREALEDAFASERGIHPGGMMWQLTAAGRAAYEALPQKDSTDGG